MHNAIVLIGPTGSGKTPLGQTLETRGLGMHACAHFDFGAELRAADRHPPQWLGPDERKVVSEALQQGKLLTDGQFSIAAKILREFLLRRRLTRGDSVILNGLPRHIGQAADLDAEVNVTLAVVLDCDEALALARIAGNAGGDRTGRNDDGRASVSRRLATYRREMPALLEHYTGRGVRVEHLSVTGRATGEDLWRDLTGRL